MKSQFTETQIAKVMKDRGVPRKSALKWLSREHLEGASAAPTRAKTTKLAEPVADVKMAAANDKPETPVKAPTEVKAKPEPTPQTAAGLARAEGLRLFKVAGRPTKEQCIAVYGERAPVMTWRQRAKAMNLATAEEAALKFQKFLKDGKTAIPAPRVKEVEPQEKRA
jgi:hypothetical protein